MIVVVVWFVFNALLLGWFVLMYFLSEEPDFELTLSMLEEDMLEGWISAEAYFSLLAEKEETELEERS